VPEFSSGLLIAIMSVIADAEVVSEQSSGTALVPVGERVVFHDEVTK
jgi:hypothetical protein